MSPLWGPETRHVSQAVAGPGAKADPAHKPHCPATALKQQVALPLVITAPTPGHPPRALPKTLQGLVATACGEGQHGLLRPQCGARFTDTGRHAASWPSSPHPSSVTFAELQVTFTQEVFSEWILCEPKDEGNGSSHRVTGEKAGGQPRPRGVREQSWPLSPLSSPHGAARHRTGFPPG